MSEKSATGGMRTTPPPVSRREAPVVSHRVARALLNFWIARDPTGISRCSRTFRYCGDVIGIIETARYEACWLGASRGGVTIAPRRRLQHLVGISFLSLLGLHLPTPESWGLESKHPLTIEAEQHFRIPTGDDFPLQQKTSRRLASHYGPCEIPKIEANQPRRPQTVDVKPIAEDHETPRHVGAAIQPLFIVGSETRAHRW